MIVREIEERPDITTRQQIHERDTPTAKDSNLEESAERFWNEFRKKAEARGVTTEYLCDSQRVKAENTVKDSIRNLLSLAHP